jgi:hypothetical protein
MYGMKIALVMNRQNENSFVKIEVVSSRSTKMQGDVKIDENIYQMQTIANI